MTIKYRKKGFSDVIKSLPNFESDINEKVKNTLLALSKKKEYDEFIKKIFIQHKDFKRIAACRKGSCIIRSIPDYKISEEIFSKRNNKVLIFDDGIDTGDHVRDTISELPRLLGYNPQEIVVVALRAKKSTVDCLKKQYSKIRFIVKEELDDVSYGMSKEFFKYLDFLGKVLDEDHMIIKFDTSEVIDDRLLRKMSNKINAELKNPNYFTSPKVIESLPKKDDLSKILKYIVLGRYSLRFQDTSLLKEIESTKIFCGYEQVKIKVYIGEYLNSKKKFKGFVKFFPIVIPILESSFDCPLLNNCDIRKSCGGTINKDCLQYIEFLLCEKLLELKVPMMLNELKQNNIEGELRYVAYEEICELFREKGRKLISRLEEKIKKM